MRTNPTFIAISVLLAVLLAGCGAAGIDETPDAEQRFHLGMRDYEKKDYFEALQHFEIIRLQFPASKVADSAKYFSGMSRYHREEYLLASYEFSQLLQFNPSSSLQEDARYMYAQCFVQMSPKSRLDQTYTLRAIDALQTFIETYPGSPRAAEAEQTLHAMIEKLAKKDFETGVLYMKLDNLRSAEVYFDTVTDKYYNTSWADDALAMKIRILMRRSKFESASKKIAAFLEKFPDSEYRGEINQYLEQVSKLEQTSSSRNH